MRCHLMNCICTFRYYVNFICSFQQCITVFLDNGLVLGLRIHPFPLGALARPRAGSLFWPRHLIFSQEHGGERVSGRRPRPPPPTIL
uniref:Uncharacterized protein n=1 Tax=Arundo donax TaxID=35708 RepID=A0A0A9GAV4_ARUDO